MARIPDGAGADVEAGAGDSQQEGALCSPLCCQVSTSLASSALPSSLNLILQVLQGGHGSLPAGGEEGCRGQCWRGGHDTSSLCLQVLSPYLLLLLSVPRYGRAVGGGGRASSSCVQLLLEAGADIGQGDEYL